MYLRKRWVAKLAEWLFGSSVAAACLAPIVANASIKGGDEFFCLGAAMCQCLDDTTGLDCSNPSGDGSQPHMFHTCTALESSEGAGVPDGKYFTCAVGCHSACAGWQGQNCTHNPINCYY
jgi:hypothetical protein